jgi:hypothetical protein
MSLQAMCYDGARDERNREGGGSSLTTWTRMPLSSSTDVAEADNFASQLSEMTGSWPHSQNVHWLLSWARGRPDNVHLYATFLDGCIAGLAGCISEDCGIQIGFGAGRIPLYTFRLQRLRLQEPLLSPHIGDPIAQQEALCALFAQLRRDNPCYPIYFEAIKLGSAVHRILTPSLIGKWYLVLQYGLHTPRHVIDVPATYEGYFSTIGRETRSGLRRSVKKLFTNFNGQVRLETFQSRVDVDRFFLSINKLVTRTWQWRRGDNMSPAIIEKLKELSKTWAEPGYFRGFILYVKDEPVAYILGYRIRDAFYLEITGYDSDWRKSAVGVVCILLSLQWMLAEDPPLRRYDFLSWDLEYKKRFGNNKWLEANFYMFPNSFRLGFVYLVLKANIKASNFLRHIYNRYRSRVGPPAAGPTTSSGTASLPRSARS